MARPTFTSTGLDSPITEFVISIGAYQGNDYIVSGAATFVAQYLAITAKHVVEHYWEEFKRTKIKTNSDRHIKHVGNFNIIGLQILNNGTVAASWDVREIYFSATTDIAYLFLVPSSDSAREYEWRFPQIDFIPPKLGSKVSAFGYRKSSADAEEDKVSWYVEPTTSTGEVIEIHYEKRDNFSVNFPSIHTNARFDPGMSGGPVFNEEGRLCAIISTNLPPSTEGEEDASYAALIWPSMAILINLKREGIDHSGRYPILELCQGGFIKCVNLDKLSLTYGDDMEKTELLIHLPKDNNNNKD